MGSAFVASSDEPLGSHVEPGRALLHGPEHGPLRDGQAATRETSLHSFSFAMPSRSLPSFGVSILWPSAPGDIERTNELNESLGTFNEGDLAFLLERFQDPVSPPGPGDEPQDHLASRSRSSEPRESGADLGVLYDVTPAIRVGASLVNVGGPNLTLRERRRRSTRGCSAGELRPGCSRARALISAGDGSQLRVYGTSLHAGSEYWLYRSVALRVGYNQDSPSAGMSYRFPSGLRVDYGLSDQELGMTHRSWRLLQLRRVLRQLGGGSLRCSLPSDSSR